MEGSTFQNQSCSFVVKSWKYSCIHSSPRIYISAIFVRERDGGNAFVEAKFVGELCVGQSRRIKRKAASIGTVTDERALRRNSRRTSRKT